MLMDVGPSILAASGVDVPSSFEGRSDLFEASGVASAARVGGFPWRIEADRVRTGESWRSSYLSAALIEEGWKYFRRDSFEGQTREQVCFDLRSDPGEQENRMGDPTTPCASLAGKLALRWTESPTWALSLTSPWKESIALGLDDPEALIGVRSARGSGASIAQKEAGNFQWQPRGSGDQLALLLAREPEGEIRVSVGSGKSVYRLEWSDLEAAGGSLELGNGEERVLVWHDLTEPLGHTYSRSRGKASRTLLQRYDHEHQFRVNVSAAAVTGDTPLVEPVGQPECRTCPYEQVCAEQMGDDDASRALTVGSLDTREAHLVQQPRLIVRQSREHLLARLRRTVCAAAKSRSRRVLQQALQRRQA